MPPYLVKPGVLLDPRTPELDTLLAAVQAACARFNYAFTITAGRDSHPLLDPHTLGRALDIRTSTLTPSMTCVLYGFLQGVLGPDFYVQYEWPPTQILASDDPRAAFAVISPGASAPHLHAQLRKDLLTLPTGDRRV